MTVARLRVGELWQRGPGRSFAGVCIAGSLVIPVVALAIPGPVRAIVSLPVVLLAPGAALQLACGRRLRGSDRWLTTSLSVVLSAGLLPLIVLAAYGIRRPLDATEIVFAVLLATLALVGVGAWQHPDERLPGEGAPRLRRPRVPARAIAAGLVIVGTGVIILVTWAALPGATPARFSAIALAGRWSHVSRVTIVPAQQVLTVAVQVQNHTARAQRYQVLPELRGSTWTTRTVTLAPGRSWTGAVQGTMPAGGCLHRLEIALRCAPASCKQSLVIWLASRKKLQKACSSTTTGA